MKGKPQRRKREVEGHRDTQRQVMEGRHTQEALVGEATATGIVRSPLGEEAGEKVLQAHGMHSFFSHVQ